MTRKLLPFFISLLLIPISSQAMTAKCYNDGKLIYKSDLIATYVSSGTLVFVEAKTHKHVIALSDCIISFKPTVKEYDNATSKR